MRIELPIETERLLIRELRLSDAAEMGEEEDWIAEKIARFHRDGGMSLWAVVDRDTGLATGLAGLQWEEIEGRRELDLGCVLAEDAQQRGYGTEASEAVVQAAFAAGFDRITALTTRTARSHCTFSRSCSSSRRERRHSESAGTPSSCVTVSVRACPRVPAAPA